MLNPTLQSRFVALHSCLRLAAMAWMAMLMLLLLDPAQAGPSNTTENDRNAQILNDKWGIQIAGIHLSANGYMVDFRYKVMDPKKASLLGDPHAKPYLIEQSSGAKLLVPKSPKVGPLRQSSEHLTSGKVYFTLFSNLGKIVKNGSKVTVVIGDFKVEDLVVQ